MFSPSIVLPIFYFSLPVAALTTAALRTRQTKDANPLREILVTFIMGAVGGLAVATFYMRMGKPDIQLTEVMIACYWGIAVACALRAFNAMLKWSVARIVPAGVDGRACCPSADVAASIARSLILLAVGMPYVGAMVLIWRPHVVHDGTPHSILGKGYQDISFTTSDGIRIRGWWIPATNSQAGDDPNSEPGFSRRTIILCHGFDSDKASDLRIVRDLALADFNVLAFDFRGHGQSDGELCTYGDLERRDVLGAVKWVQGNHPRESRKIFGLGVGLGSAALIAAAADEHQGQAIDAVAVFAPYDQLTTMIQGFEYMKYAPRIGWLATHISLPIAGAQLGTPLAHFSPAQYVDKIAPRPLLVIAAEQDETTDVSLSIDLYEQASQPKYAYWIKKGSRESMLYKNVNASRVLRVFFETARNIL